MTRIMDQTAVAAIRAEMDKAKTNKTARRCLARAALARDNLTTCGRAEWQKELSAHDPR
jgi:hypothetical protein